MNVTKKDLTKSQIELTVELSVEEFRPYIKRGAEKVSREVKIEGFRPGKVPYEVLKQKIGEMTILEEAARIAVNKTIEVAIKENVTRQLIGQPQIDITKIAPNNPLEYKVTLAIVPEVKLGDYKNAKVKLKKAEIKDEEVEKIVRDLQEMKTKESIDNREVRDSDKVVVDMQMFLDKVPIEGGQNKDTAIIIGKNYIVPGFDQKLLGAKKGDKREFSLPYPDDYHMKNLAGKIVEFEVTIKEVYKRELPKLDDVFAQGFGAKKMVELKDNIRKSILSQKKRESEQATEKEMLEKIMEKSRFGDIPEMLVDHEVKTMIAELEQTIENQGGKFEDYLSSINKTRDQLTLDLLPEAVKRVKVSLLIREVAVLEKVKVEAEEAENYIKEMKKHYQKDKGLSEKINTSEYKNYVLNILTSRKVVDKLREWNVDR
jgi:trigger factor